MWCFSEVFVATHRVGSGEWEFKGVTEESGQALKFTEGK
jgi:hypothetical protein